MLRWNYHAKEMSGEIALGRSPNGWMLIDKKGLLRTRPKSERHFLEKTLKTNGLAGLFLAGV